VNLRFLGDAFDHWKGSLFECLTREGSIQDFAVEPMFSDRCLWSEEQLSVFARLLRVSPNQFVSHSHDLAASRAVYFQELSHTGDLFLDPDTGIATGHVRQPAQYVFPTEVRELVAATPGRVIAVYQYVRACRVRVRIDKILRAVSQLPVPQPVSGIHWCSYESSSVAMLFFSSTQQRVQSITESLSGLLGSRAEGRVRHGRGAPA